MTSSSFIAIANPVAICFCEWAKDLFDQCDFVNFGSAWSHCYWALRHGLFRIARRSQPFLLRPWGCGACRLPDRFWRFSPRVRGRLFDCAKATFLLKSSCQICRFSDFSVWNEKLPARPNDSSVSLNVNEPLPAVPTVFSSTPCLLFGAPSIV